MTGTPAARPSRRRTGPGSRRRRALSISPCVPVIRDPPGQCHRRGPAAEAAARASVARSRLGLPQVALPHLAPPGPHRCRVPSRCPEREALAALRIPQASPAAQGHRASSACVMPQCRRDASSRRPPTPERLGPCPRSAVVACIPRVGRHGRPTMTARRTAAASGDRSVAASGGLSPIATPSQNAMAARS